MIDFLAAKGPSMFPYEVDDNGSSWSTKYVFHEIVMKGLESRYERCIEYSKTTENDIKIMTEVMKSLLNNDEANEFPCHGLSDRFRFDRRINKETQTVSRSDAPDVYTDLIRTKKDREEFADMYETYDQSDFYPDPDPNYIEKAE